MKKSKFILIITIISVIALFFIFNKGDIEYTKSLNEEFKSRFWIQDTQGVFVGRIKVDMPFSEEILFNGSSDETLKFSVVTFCNKGEESFIYEKLKQINIKAETITSTNYEIVDVSEDNKSNNSKYSIIRLDITADIIKAGRVENIVFVFEDDTEVTFNIGIDIIAIDETKHPSDIPKISRYSYNTKYHRNSKKLDPLYSKEIRSDGSSIWLNTHKPYKDIEILDVIVGENFTFKMKDNVIEAETMSDDMHISEEIFVDIFPKNDNNTNIFISPVYKIKIGDKVEYISSIITNGEYIYDDNFIEQIKINPVKLR